MNPWAFSGIHGPILKRAREVMCRSNIDPKLQEKLVNRIKSLPGYAFCVTSHFCRQTGLPATALQLGKFPRKLGMPFPIPRCLPAG
jgi:hypothetical protein